MSGKQIHDSTLTFKPIIYQFYIALERCFNLLENESIFIEKYGDVTVSNSIQIEVKDYKSDITDLDHNIWKTLKNWLQKDFDISYYKSLVLLTTQDFSKNTSFKNWNDKNRSEKKKILELIKQKYDLKEEKSKETQKLLDFVLNLENSKKLLEILEKFDILDSSLKDDDYYLYLKEKYCKCVLYSSSDNFINSLLGFIISPEKTSNNWEITYEDFTKKFRSLVKIYSSGTIVFPKRKTPKNLEENKFSEHLFIKKIEDIKYNQVKSEAISDYVKVNTVISQELSEHKIGKEVYEDYEEQIKKIYENKYRNACLDVTQENQIKDSKKFYNNITALPSPTLIYFNDTPDYFKNGILHSMADDEKENIIWKLKVEDE